MAKKKEVIHLMHPDLDKPKAFPRQQALEILKRQAARKGQTKWVRQEPKPIKKSDPERSPDTKASKEASK